MRSPEQYRAAILAALSPMPIVELGLVEAEGAVLAEDVVSSISLPQFDNSAMDGYAVRSSDVGAASHGHPVRLRVLGDIAAGDVAKAVVEPGTALRIMTGAPLPAGADTVVKVEDTDGGAEDVLVRASAAPGLHVRRAGEDVSPGTTVLTRGSVLRARQIGLLAAIGRARVRVHAQPTVVVVPTGSELLALGEPPRPGAIYDSNGPMIGSAVRAAGARVIVMPAVTDDDAAFATVIDEAAQAADLIVTTGGVSMGAYDTAKAVLSARGTVVFEKVAMNPGKPQGFGHVGTRPTPIITLPGNPVSAFVSFECFVRPAIRTLQGHAVTERPRRTASITMDLGSPPGKEQFARAIVSGTDELSVAPVGLQGSHVMGGLGAANALIVVPAETTAVPAGSVVEIIDLREDA